MNDEFDMNKFKSMKFPIKYNNADSDRDYGHYDSEIMKDKLSLLENYLNNSIKPNKILDKTNIDFIPNFIEDANNSNHLGKSNKINIQKTEPDSSYKLQDIKLNHEILLGKIENMRKTLQITETDLGQNTKTKLKNNLLENYDFRLRSTKKADDKENHSKNNESFRQNNPNREFTAKVNYDNSFDRLILETDYSNINKNSKLTANNKENFMNNSYSIKGKNFYQHYNNNLRKTLNNQKQSESGYKSFIDNKYLNRNRWETEHNSNILLKNLNIENYDVKVDYTKKDLDELEDKIKTTQDRLNECLLKTENIVLENKNKNSIIPTRGIHKLNKEFFSEIKDNNEKHYYQDSERKAYFITEPAEEADFKNVLDKEIRFKTINYEHLKSERNKNTHKRHIKNHIKEHKSLAKFLPNSSVEKPDNYEKNYLKPQYHDETDAFSMKSENILGNKKNKNQKEFKSSTNTNFKGLTSMNTSIPRTENINNNDENMKIHQTLTNTFNTINVMDSLIFSGDSNPEDENNFSDVNLNLSSIAADLRNIKKQNSKNLQKKNFKISYAKEKEMMTTNSINNVNNIEKQLSSNVDQIFEKENKTYKKYLEMNKIIGERLSLLNKPSEISEINTNRTHQRFNVENKTKYLHGEQISNSEEYDRKSLKITKNYDSEKYEDKNKLLNYDHQQIKHNNAIEKEVFEDTGNGKLLKVKKNKGIEYREKMAHEFSKNNALVKEVSRVNFTELEIKDIITKYFMTEKIINKEDIDERAFEYLRNEIIKEIIENQKLDIGIQQNSNFDKNEEKSTNYNKSYSNYKEDFESIIHHKANAMTPQSYNINKINSENYNIKIHKTNTEHREKQLKIQQILNKIPEIINEFKSRKEKIVKIEEKELLNIKNLDKLIDVNKLNLNRNNESLNKSINKKNILDEADNIIKNHILRLEKRSQTKQKNELSTYNESNLHDHNIENSNIVKYSQNAKMIKITDKIKNEHNEESVNNKINYIYDFLKNFSNSKLKDLISGNDNMISKTAQKTGYTSADQIKAIDNSNREDYNDGLNSEKYLSPASKDLYYDSKMIVTQNTHKKKLENLNNILMNNKEDNNSGEFLVKAEANLQTPKSKIILDNSIKESKSHLLNTNNKEPKFEEILTNNNFDENHFNDLSNINNINDNLNNSKISDFKNTNDFFLSSKNNKGNNNITNNKIIFSPNNIKKIYQSPNPYELIEKREEKLIDENIFLKKPEIAHSPHEAKLNIKGNEKEQRHHFKNNQISSEQNKVLNNNNEHNSELYNQTSDNKNEISEKSTRKVGFSQSINNFYTNNSKNENEENKNSQERNLTAEVHEENDYNNNNSVINEAIGDVCNNSEQNIYGEEEPRCLEDFMNSNINNISNYKADYIINGKNIINSEVKLKSKLKLLNKKDIVNKLKYENVEKEKEYDDNNDVSEQANETTENDIKVHKKVKFDSFLNSNSGHVKNSRNKTKNKIVENELPNNLDIKEVHNNDSYCYSQENEEEEKDEYANINTNAIIDIPIGSHRKINKVNFSDKLVFIQYDDDSYAQDIRVFNQQGKTEKHQKFNLLKYLIRIKNNKYKTKKILHYYYNGLRDDRLPKKLLASLKRSNSFNEQDKILGLKKLNEFLEECNKENQLSELEQQKKRRIVERNLNTIHEIQKARKSASKRKKMRSPTPKKAVHSHVCRKFTGDPSKFFSTNPPNSILKAFNLVQNPLSSIKKSNNKITDKNLNNIYDRINTFYNSASKGDQNKSQNFTNTKKYAQDLHEFNVNSDPSNKNEKEKVLNNIISNINLEEL